MLFTKSVSRGLADGTVTLAFRRWDRPHARAGQHQRIPDGIVAIDSVDIVDAGSITAGAASVPHLRADLDRRPTGDVYRMSLRFVGVDERIALRQRSTLTDVERTEVEAHLDRLDRASRRGPWTAETLELIDARPGVRAADLAALVDCEKQPFKLDVRKLKALGLTESLEVGYRLSPRGQVVLAAIRLA